VTLITLVKIFSNLFENCYLALLLMLGPNTGHKHNKAAGRFKAWHVKDMDDQRRFATVGERNIDI
jgi:hypothetical protein